MISGWPSPQVSKRIVVPAGEVTVPIVVSSSYRTVVLYSTVLHGYGTVQYYQEEILRRARGRTGECGRRNRPVRASPPGDHPGGHRGVPAARIPRRDHGRGRRPRT